MRAGLNLDVSGAWEWRREDEKVGDHNLLIGRFGLMLESHSV